MRFDLKNSEDLRNATMQFNAFKQEGVVIELKKARSTRTIKQNKYLHLILKWFALEYGENLDYVKQVIFKKLINKEYFVKEIFSKKTGEVIEITKSTSELNTKELTECIERFRDFSSKELGVYLPTPNEQEKLNQIENQLEKFSNKIYS